ncbi:glycosyltransferase family 2 protein [Leptospira sp. 'Mane']|uniref:glycosyltransferase family 2 protein n=1 Tax=Leptospira sp. 'Mane' TaxID=3387407 RepID=UPI00398A8783
MKTVSFITINYNGDRFFQNFLDSFIGKLEDLDYEIVIVDNNSSPDSKKNLFSIIESHSLKNKIRLIESEKNLGFSNGNNLGVSHAEGKYVYFINNDMILDRLHLKEDINLLETDNNIGAIGNKLYFAGKFIKLTIPASISKSAKLSIDATEIRKIYNKILTRGNGVKDHWDELEINGSLIDGNALSIYLPINSFFYDHHLDELNINLEDPLQSTADVLIGNSKVQLKSGLNRISYRKEDCIELIQNNGSYLTGEGTGGDFEFAKESEASISTGYKKSTAICGGAFFISKKLFWKVGGFHSSYFAYYEDTDLSLMIRRLGFELVVNQNTKIFHHHAGSSKEFSPYFVYNVNKSHLIYLFRHAGWFCFISNFLQKGMSLFSKSVIHKFQIIKALSVFLFIAPKILIGRISLTKTYRFLLFGMGTEIFFKEKSLAKKDQLISFYLPDDFESHLKNQNFRSVLNEVAETNRDKNLFLISNSLEVITKEQLERNLSIRLPENVRLIGITNTYFLFYYLLRISFLAKILSSQYLLRKFINGQNSFFNLERNTLFFPTANRNFLLLESHNDTSDHAGFAYQFVRKQYIKKYI